MAKPSIFSRDYEKKMKKRKAKIIALISIVAIIAGVFIYKFKIEKIDFSNVRAKLQAWADSDNQIEQKPKEESKVNEAETKPEPPKKTYMDVKLGKNLVLKCEYKTVDDKKEFVSVEDVKGLNYDISPNKQMILTLDENQNMQLIDIDGKVKDITRKEYVSTKGQKFHKESILKREKKYLWTSDAKFLDDDCIVYISNLPYFGTAAKNQYAWIYNIKNNTNIFARNTKAKNIELGKVVPKKGIEIKIDKNEYVLNDKGSILK